VRRAHDTGFALVEVLVAAAIVATMMALTYRVIATDAAASAQLMQRRAAALLAQSVLEQAAAAPDAADPVRGGRSGDFAWSVDRAPYAGSGRGDARLTQVTVRIMDARRRPVFLLSTLRFGR